MITIVDGGRMPEMVHALDAGYQCYAREIDVKDGMLKARLGFYLTLNYGYYVDVRPLSSICTTGLIMCQGTVSPGYRGEVIACFFTAWPSPDAWYKVGDPVCQIVLAKRNLL